MAQKEAMEKESSMGALEKCSLCGLDFASKEDLTEHTIKVHSNKPSA